MNPEEKTHYENVIREEIQKQMEENEPKESHPLRNEAFSVGGGAVGGGLGLASLNAIDVGKEQLSLRSADAKNKEIQVWNKLKAIRDGRDSWDTVHPSAKPALQQLYTDHVDLLGDEASFKNHMNSLGPQTVFRIGQPESKGQILKRMMPNGKVIDNLATNLQRPAVSVGALGGMAAGYYLSKTLDK